MCILFVLIVIKCEGVQEDVDKLRGNNICKRVQGMAVAMEGSMGGMLDYQMVSKLGHLGHSPFHRNGNDQMW